MSTIIYKIGGSLLSLPDLPHRLRTILEQPVPFATVKKNASVNPLLVVGGGPVADAVRDWDQIYKLGDELAHDLALRSMSFNAHVVAAILQEARVVANGAEARAAWMDGKVAVLASAEFVEQEERASGDLLPRSWNVTSDSIAAFAASRWPAAALVLLKSTDLPGEFDVQTAARNGLVDPNFPAFADRLPTIGWANLRADEPIIRQRLMPGRGNR